MLVILVTSFILQLNVYKYIVPIVILFNKTEVITLPCTDV